jgi:hypothetical protein
MSIATTYTLAIIHFNRIYNGTLKTPRFYLPAMLSNSLICAKSIWGFCQIISYYGTKVSSFSIK